MAGKNIIKEGKLVVLKKANLVKELQRVGGGEERQLSMVNRE
jgi:hypothetical protein